MYISVVIAAYNEERNVSSLTKRIFNELNKRSIPHEVIYIIEGNDNTYPILKKLKNDYGNKLRLFYKPKPQGFANAFKDGFSKVSKKATHILTLDADLNHQPEEMYRLINQAKEGYDIVIGSRGVKGAVTLGVPPLKRFVSSLANKIFYILTPLKIKDKTSNYRLIKKDVLNKIVPKIQSTNFEFCIEFLIIANKMNYKITEVPITFRYRKYEKSKFQLLKVASGCLKLLILKRRQ